jgi:hypothetical protein
VELLNVSEDRLSFGSVCGVSHRIPNSCSDAVELQWSFYSLRFSVCSRDKDGDHESVALNKSSEFGSLCAED